MPDNMTMKLYINDHSSAVPFVITPNKPFTLDLTDSATEPYFYHCSRDLDIPIINQIRFEFLDSNEIVIDSRTIYMARDLQYQLYTNLPPDSVDGPDILIPHSWSEVFSGSSFNIGYYTPFRFNIYFDKDYSPRSELVSATLLEKATLDDLFDNLRIGYSLSYIDVETDQEVVKYIDRGKINSGESIYRSWKYDHDFWNPIYGRPPICSINADYLTRTYNLSKSEYETYMTQCDYNAPYYLSLTPISLTSGSSINYITDSFGVPYSRIKNNTKITIIPIIYIGTITNYNPPSNGFFYFTNMLGEPARRSFIKREEIIASVKISNTDITYNPEVLKDNGIGWVGNYNPESQVTADTSIDITVNIKEQ